MIFMKFCVRAWALVVHGQWKSGTSFILDAIDLINSSNPTLHLVMVVGGL
jgi:hypothetical protein